MHSAHPGPGHEEEVRSSFVKTEQRTHGEIRLAPMNRSLFFSLRVGSCKDAAVREMKLKGNRTRETFMLLQQTSYDSNV